MSLFLKMYRRILLFLCLLFPILTDAQPHQLENLVYNADGSVTFIFDMPGSKRVRLYCDCELRKEKTEIRKDNLHSVRMHSDSDGVFSYTTPPLAPEIYTYQFRSRGKQFVDPANPDSIRVLNSKRSLFVVAGSPLSDLCLTDSLYGSTELFDCLDTFSGKVRSVFLYLPPGYWQTDRQYPTLYLLHGINGNEKAWQEKGRVMQMADNLIRQGKIVPMVIVMPDANPRKLIGQKDNIGMLQNLIRYPSWLRRDFEIFFPAMDSMLTIRYRLASEADGRAVAGLSAGATQAANLANMYEGYFRYVGLFSPVVHRKQLPETDDAIYWIGAGKVDIFRPQINRYVRNLHRNQITYTYYETEGGHTWRNWRLYLAEFLQTVFAPEDSVKRKQSIRRKQIIMQL